MSCLRSTSGSKIETVIILFFLFILGKGIQKTLSRNKRCSKIGEHFYLPAETTVQLYEPDSLNARLKLPEVYDDDSLKRSKQLQETQNAHFFHYFSSFRDIFKSVMSGDDCVFFEMQFFTIYIYLKY